MEVNYTLIAVFTDEKKSLLGNVAAVVETELNLSEQQMQKIALQLNQPATSFLFPQKEGYKIRWFAPDAEIQLCGHGAMGAAAYCWENYNKTVPFTFSKGAIEVAVHHNILSVQLPKGNYHSDTPPVGLEEALGVHIKAYYSTSDKDLVVVDSKEELARMKPDFFSLKKMKPFGYAVTAAGEGEDFVSRTLVPKVQQLEDHATGSSHTVLAPFWSEVLGQSKMHAVQLSPRGGAMTCEVNGLHVILSGAYELLAQGKIYC